MKVCNFAVFASIYLLFFIPANAENDFSDFVDFWQNESFTPAQFHQFEANLKAKRLEQAWLDYNDIQQATRHDMAEYDVTFYQLNMEIDLIEEYVDSASLTMTARSLIDGLETIELDFIDSIIYPDPYDLYEEYPDTLFLAVDSIYNSSGQLSFAHENNKLVIDLDHPYNIDEEFEVMVRYHGHPYATYGFANETVKFLGRGLAFGYQNHFFNPTSTIPVGYTDCQPYDSRRWWPCKDTPSDKPDSMDINITVDEPYYCASNGRLDQIAQIKGGVPRREFRYKIRCPIYTSVVSLAISEYTIWTDWYFFNDGNDSMPIVNHVYPYFIDEAQESWNITPQCLEIFADAFGEYPFINEKYGHAQYENYGMEHQTITAMPSIPWAHTTEYLIIHELAHDWWGDMITCATWHDTWLNEGFATYSEAIYYEGLFGENGYRAQIESDEYWGNRSVYVYDTTDASNVFNTAVYRKGAWVLHSLRYVIGDEMFFNLLHAYANSEYKYGTVTTEQFINFCNDFTGLNLDEFFNDWVYDIMYPAYAKATYVLPDLGDGKYWTCLNFYQTQTYGPDVFEMPVDLRFYSGTTVILDTTINNDARAQRLAFKTVAVPDSIVVDPNNWILNTVFDMVWKYSILPLPLDSADQYVEYLDTIICHGGSGHNQFQVVSGAMPSGLVLDSETGIIFGSPGESGEFTFTVRSDDNYSNYSSEIEFNLFVNEGAGLAGDSNNDKDVDILDVVYIINYKYKDGTPPPVPSFADPNADCSIDILDVVYLINYKYKDGPDPQFGCAVL